jgi:hypothetical protein
MPSIACDICGNYMGITPYDNKNSISFLHRYRVFNGYKDYQNQSYFFPSSAYKVAHGNTPADSLLVKNNTYSSKDFESYKIFELRLKYFIVNRLELNVFIPIANNKSLTNGVSVGHTGFGDISANVAYHFITPKADQKMRHKLIVGLGMKLPTGNFRAHDANNDRLPFEMQSGTGSIDGFGYINYTFMTKHFGANLTLNYKLNGTNSYHEHLANSTTNFATIFYKIPVKKMTFYPSIQANYECSNGLYNNQDLEEDSQVNSLLVGPGLDIYYKSVSVNASWQFTAIEHVNSGDLKSAGRITLGINYSFGNREKK